MPLEELKALEQSEQPALEQAEQQAALVAAAAMTGERSPPSTAATFILL